MDEKVKVIEEAIKELGYKSEKDFLPTILEKYVLMGGAFSLCGATHSIMQLKLKDDFQILDNIAYTLGLTFTGFKTKT